MAELENELDCPVCGKHLKFLVMSHMRIHGFKKACEVYEKYPHIPKQKYSRFDEWRNSEKNKNHMRNQNAKTWASAERREKHRKGVQEATQKPEYRTKLSKLMKEYAQTPKGKAHLQNKPVTPRMKMSNYDRWLADGGQEYADQKQIEWQDKNKLPSTSRNTAIEIEMKDAFVANGYEVNTQFRVPPKYCDLYISKLNLIVETYGDYWHANPVFHKSDSFIGHKRQLACDIWRNDQERLEYLRSKGFNVEIVWGSDIKKIGAEKIVQELSQRYEKI